jgi:hypothetical protein
MSERIGWMPGSKSGFSVSHKYTEIKIQKIRYQNATYMFLYVSEQVKGLSPRGEEVVNSKYTGDRILEQHF